MSTKKNAYTQIIEKVFFTHYREGIVEFTFTREELLEAARSHNIKLPKNIGDLIYFFRYRNELPDSIRTKAPKGLQWIIRPAGQAKYAFAAVLQPFIVPNENLAITKIPNATPGVIAMYALSDEQALLAILRYNRLIDIFTGVTCYSLQNHLRTFVKELGQIETDEIYVGLDKKGIHFVFPVQAKGGKDKISIVQIEQDYAMCKQKFSSLICRPIAAQFIDENLIALFELEQGDRGLCIYSEKHYLLVAPSDLSSEELAKYANRTSH